MSKVQETLSEMAKDLYSVGGIDKTTLRRFDINSLPPVPNYTATQIAALRHKLGLSSVGSKRSPYSVIFLGKIACRYVVFKLPDDYLELAQTLLTGYFKKLEEG